MDIVIIVEKGRLEARAPHHAAQALGPHPPPSYAHHTLAARGQVHPPCKHVQEGTFPSPRRPHERAQSRAASSALRL